MKNNSNYIHGYSAYETKRLLDQAITLKNFIHNDSVFPEGSLVLEAGCGIGAQSEIMLQMNPFSKFVAVDRSKESLDHSQSRLYPKYSNNIEYYNSDLHCLPFDDNTFDFIVIHFVLEHVSSPYLILKELKRVLKNGGKITSVEGDHGSAFFFPESTYAQQVIQCQTKLQSLFKGHTNIGRELYPLFDSLSFNKIEVVPITLYIDKSKPDLVEGFVRQTYTAMIKGIRDDAIKYNIIDEATFDRGINDLYRTAKDDGVFCYTFIKLIAVK